MLFFFPTPLRIPADMGETVFKMGVVTEVRFQTRKNYAIVFSGLLRDHTPIVVDRHFVLPNGRHECPFPLHLIEVVQYVRRRMTFPKVESECVCGVDHIRVLPTVASNDQRVTPPWRECTSVGFWFPVH